MNFLNRILVAFLVCVAFGGIVFSHVSVAALPDSSALAFKQNWSPISFPETGLPKNQALSDTLNQTPKTTTPTTQIYTYPSQELNKIFPNGGNIEHHQPELGEPQYVYNVKSLKTKYLRFPGGSRSDLYIWNENSETRKDLVDYLNLVISTKTEPVIAFNFGSFRNNPDQGAEVARDLTEYLNSPDDGTNPNGGINWALARTKDGFKEPFNVKYFEVGNENYGEWESGTCDNYPQASSENCTNRLSPSQYINSFKKYQSEVKTISPKSFWGIALSNNSHAQWDSQTVSETKQNTDFYDLHLYPFKKDDYSKTTTELLKIARENTQKSVQYAQKVMSDTGNTDKPLIIGEYNATTPEYKDLIEKSALFPSSLYLSEMMGVFAEKEIGTGLFWGFTSGYDESIGSNGAAGYNLFTNDKAKNTPIYTPYPVYYTQYLWNQMGDTLINSNSKDPSIRTWASSYTGGKNGQAVMMLNTSDEPKSPTINFEDQIGNASTYSLTGNINEPKIFVNSITTSGQYGGPFPDQIKPTTTSVNSDKYTLSLAPHSLTLIQVNTIKKKVVATTQSDQNTNIPPTTQPSSVQTFVDNNLSGIAFGALTVISLVILAGILIWQTRSKSKIATPTATISPVTTPIIPDVLALEVASKASTALVQSYQPRKMREMALKAKLPTTTKNL